jgi:hypothetical protein
MGCVWMKNKGLCCVDEEQWVVWMFHANNSSKRWKWKENGETQEKYRESNLITKENKCLCG